MGGNCQGAAVAAEMASLLALANKGVRTLFVMEWMRFLPGAHGPLLREDTVSNLASAHRRTMAEDAEAVRHAKPCHPWVEDPYEPYGEDGVTRLIYG
jgi:hypothetical protein